jgi:hypothetical protein
MLPSYIEACLKRVRSSIMEPARRVEMITNKEMPG